MLAVLTAVGYNMVAETKMFSPSTIDVLEGELKNNPAAYVKAKSNIAFHL